MLQKQQSQHHQPLLLLKKYHQFIYNKSLTHANNNNHTQISSYQHTALLVHQRMIYLIATSLSNNQPLPQGINLVQELTLLINKINIKVMSTSTNQLIFQQKLNLISKCVDLLYYNPIKTHIPVFTLLQLRALTFNNLSCIYKQNNQLQDALKSLSISLQIQQALLQKNYQDYTYKSIASTYINKCVILSSMSMHQQAIQTIKTSLEHIGKYKEKFGEEIKLKQNNQIKHMTMLAYFNIAVEYQYLKYQDMSIKFYQMAWKLAKEVGNFGVKNQAMDALRKLKMFKKG